MNLNIILYQYKDKNVRIVIMDFSTYIEKINHSKIFVKPEKFEKIIHKLNDF